MEINKIPGLDPFNNLYHLSEVICSMDFIVTISNTTAHLSASLGVPTLFYYQKILENYGIGQIISMIKIYGILMLKYLDKKYREFGNTH